MRIGDWKYSAKMMSSFSGRHDYAKLCPLGVGYYNLIRKGLAPGEVLDTA